MTCRGKRRYDSPQAARRVIDKARERRRHGGLNRQERRAFQCRHCKGWHVTSEPYRASEEAA